MSPILDEARTGNTAADLKQAILDNLYFIQGLIPALATPNDWYMALAYSIRDRMMNDWITAFTTMRKGEVKIVSYLSAEFLLGPQLANNLLNLRLRENVQEALSGLNLDLQDILKAEQEPGLGNGGLGRLAACFMDS
jgi:starch phosphorylase